MYIKPCILCTVRYKLWHIVYQPSNSESIYSMDPVYSTARFTSISNRIPADGTKCPWTHYRYHVLVDIKICGDWQKSQILEFHVSKLMSNLTKKNSLKFVISNNRKQHSNKYIRPNIHNPWWPFTTACVRDQYSYLPWLHIYNTTWPVHYCIIYCLTYLLVYLAVIVPEHL